MKRHEQSHHNDRDSSDAVKVQVLADIKSSFKGFCLVSGMEAPTEKMMNDATAVCFVAVRRRPQALRAG